MPRQLVDITSPMLQAFADAYDRGVRNKQMQFDNEQKTTLMKQREQEQKEQIRQFDEMLKMRKEEEKRRETADKAAREHQDFLRNIAVREAIKSGVVRPNEQPEVFESINQLAAGNPSVQSTPVVDQVTALGMKIPRNELPEETTEQYRARLAGMENEADLERATIAAQSRLSAAQLNQNAQDNRQNRLFKQQKELEGIKQGNRLALKATPSASSAATPGSMDYEVRRNYLTPFISGSAAMTAKERQAYAKDLSEWQWVDDEGNIEGRGAVPIAPASVNRLKSYAPAVRLIATLKEFEDAVKSRNTANILIASSKLDGQLATMRELMGQQAYGVLNIPEVARLRGNLPQKWETISDFVKGSSFIKQRRESLAKQYMKQLDSELAVTPHIPQKRYLMQQYNLWLPKELQPNGR